MARAWLTSVRKALWIATTPLALTLLLAGTGRAQVSDGVQDAPPPASPAAEAPKHEYLKNPIQNLLDFSYSGKDAHGAKYVEGVSAHKMPPPFSMALLNFGVLIFLIGKYAAPSFGRMVRDRHDLIAKQLAESTRLRDEAQAKLTEYTRKIDGLQAEIDALVRGLRTEADAEKARIIAEAELRAQRMKAEAEQQIQVEIQRVRTTLEREAVLAAMAVAEQILREKTTDTDQRALAERFVKSVAAAPAGGGRPREPQGPQE